MDAVISGEVGFHHRRSGHVYCLCVMNEVNTLWQKKCHFPVRMYVYIEADIVDLIKASKKC